MPDREKVIKRLQDVANICALNGDIPSMTTIGDALALLKSQSPGWISVTERLPELNQKVLVYAIGKIDGFIGDSVMALTDRMIFRLFPSSNGEETWSTPWQYFHTDYEITHWMPLPEPPKGEVDERR